jgi:endonuclease YncB( thermonuclease family)
MRIRTIQFLFILAAFTATASAQFLTTGGEVVEVIDGRTIVVASPAGRVKVELQFIEVPEPQQSMHEEAKAHLRDLVFGKVVEVRPFRLHGNRTIGRVTLKDVDVSQQMLRDGAAWHPVAGVGQESNEQKLYSDTQAAARSEKRGVWSVPGLKPAWEFRAEKAAKAEIKNAAVRPSARPSVSSKRPGAWGDINPAIGEVGMLTHGFSAAKRLGYVSTMFIRIEPNEEEKASNGATYLDVTYHYKEDLQKGRTGVFVVSLISYSRTPRFAKNNDLYLMDGKKTLIGKATRTVTTEDDLVKEKLVYTVERSSIEKLTLGVGHLKFGDRLIEPRSFGYTILYNMLQISGKTQVASADKPKK